MKQNELVKGNIYHADYDGTGTHTYIIKYSGTLKINNYIRTHNSTFENDGGNLSANTVFRPATLQEITHLEACEKAGKFVPAPELNPIYQLFN
jgi:hypothetical protein